MSSGSTAGAALAAALGRPIPAPLRRGLAMPMTMGSVIVARPPLRSPSLSSWRTGAAKARVLMRTTIQRPTMPGSLLKETIFCDGGEDRVSSVSM